MTQKELFLSLTAYLEAAGVVSFQFLPCGCKALKFATGGRQRDLCWKHAHKIPRDCPCGLNRALSKATSEAFRKGDIELAESLRIQRRAHQCEGK